MNEYRIEFGYVLASGTMVVDYDKVVASTAQEAVNSLRFWYSDLLVCIRQVWIDRDGRWEVVEGWE